MKKLFFISVALLTIIFFNSCSNDEEFYGSGVFVTETRDVSNFSKIYNEGIANVTIIQGETQSLEIVADDNIIHRVITTVNNNELLISLQDGNYNNINIEAFLTVTSLDGLKNSGIGNISANEINNQNQLLIENSGTGDISISGIGNSMNIYNEGSGAVYGYDYTTSNSSIEIIGSGDCNVFVTDILDVIIEGSGNVYYKGTPSINTTISGSGSVINSN